MVWRRPGVCLLGEETKQGPPQSAQQRTGHPAHSHCTPQGPSCGGDLKRYFGLCAAPDRGPMAALLFLQGCSWPCSCPAREQHGTAGASWRPPATKTCLRRRRGAQSGPHRAQEHPAEQRRGVSRGDVRGSQGVCSKQHTRRAAQLGAERPTSVMLWDDPPARWPCCCLVWQQQRQPRGDEQPDCISSALPRQPHLLGVALCCPVPLLLQ